MRFSIVATVLAFGSTVLAQGLLDQIPKCAQTCFGNNLGSCGPVDIGCVCGNKAVINSVSCCVFATCSQADIQQTTTFAVQLCKTAGVNVDTNPPCPSGNATASASASGSRSSSMSSATSSSSATAASVSNAASFPLQTAGAGLGLGLAVAGMLALF